MTRLDRDHPGLAEMALPELAGPTSSKALRTRRDRRISMGTLLLYVALSLHVSGMNGAAYVMLLITVFSALAISQEPADPPSEDTATDSA